jgi:cellulose synthase/poly-beta-1,6-N-acetylglucosamine synthase-like glycosyltransferase
VQARLAIDNTDDGILARLFTAEYAAQFEVFLDGLSAFGLPLPLGGSSNHFTTAALRELGGWDAWNVTEDADLGIRLARFGYRTTTIASTTHEEAPARLKPWLRQRTRWFKGWMQTWCVHMRDPLALWRELGPRGFFGFQLVVGGNVLAALIHPVCMATLLAAAIAGNSLSAAGEPFALTLALLYGVSLMTGYVSSAVLGVIGLSRQGLVRCAPVLLLTPLHWLLLSLAAWRALHQFVIAPYAWEKTEHGLARHSRRAKRLVAALVEMEREVEAMRAAEQSNRSNENGRTNWSGTGPQGKARTPSSSRKLYV